MADLRCSDNFKDNTKKKLAREFLVNVCNYHFKKHKNLNMLEFLGSGVGAEYYSKNLKNLKNIFCVESNYKLFNEYTPPNPIIKPYNRDAYDFLKECRIKESFDIINLDFCTFFCDEVMKTTTSSGQTVRNVLSTRRFDVGSIIFTTFLLNGFQVSLSKYKDSILTSPEDIIKTIVDIGKENKIILKPLDETFLYRPGERGWNTMMHTGFIVDEML